MNAVLSNPPVVRATPREVPRLARLERGRVMRVAERGDGDVPDDAWSLDDLTARAVAEQEIIERADRLPTVHYWFQGKALNAARKHISKGAWGDYLRACHISKDQARSARKLARAYPGADVLTRLSVREALWLARGEATRPETARLLRNLAARLRHALEAVRHVAQTVETCDERAALVNTIERTGTALSALARGAAKGEHR